MENRYKELENERLLMGDQLENDKSEFHRRLREAENEREDLLNKNRVKFHSLKHSIYLYCSFIGT